MSQSASPSPPTGGPDAPEPEAQAAPERAAPSRKLLEQLVCPVTHGRLRYDRTRHELISDSAGLAYPIRDGIPILLEDEARQLDP